MTFGGGGVGLGWVGMGVLALGIRGNIRTWDMYLLLLLPLQGTKPLNFGFLTIFFFFFWSLCFIDFILRFILIFSFFSINYLDETPLTCVRKLLVY